MVKEGQQIILSYPVQIAISQQGKARLSFHLSGIYTATKDKTGKEITGIEGLRLSYKMKRFKANYGY